MSAQAGLPVEQRRFGVQEGLTLLGLGFGFLLPLIGFLAALAGLWTSRFWTRREKIVATALIPLTVLMVLVVALLNNFFFHYPLAGWHFVIVSVLVAPVIAALYLLSTTITRHHRPHHTC